LLEIVREALMVELTEHWQDVHTVDAAVGEEIENGDVACQAVETEPLLHIVPGPTGAELQPLSGRSILLAAFLKKNTGMISRYLEAFLQKKKKKKLRS
jgi:hypothetical protein